jgi:hypothetical protein
MCGDKWYVPGAMSNLDSDQLIINLQVIHDQQIVKSFNNSSVTTLALGSRPRQGLIRLRTKREARESHYMLLGM